MMYEILRWASIILLWLAIAANIAATVMNVRIRRRLRASVDVMDGIVRDWEEKHGVRFWEDEDEG